LESKAWNVAKKCSLAADNKATQFWETIANQGASEPKYGNVKALALIEDFLELWCPIFIGDKRVSKFGCAVARCPQVKTLPKQFKVFQSLKRGPWDNIVCLYDKPIKGSCFSGLGKNKIPQRSFVGHNLQFSRKALTKYENDLRHAADPELNPIKWSTPLENSALKLAKKCDPKYKATPTSFGEGLSGPWSSPVLNNVELKLYVEDSLDSSCPDLITNPTLKKFACAGIICPGKPKGTDVTKHPWASIVCLYDTPSTTCTYNADHS